jgi:hypothetical protein
MEPFRFNYRGGMASLAVALQGDWIDCKVGMSVYQINGGGAPDTMTGDLQKITAAGEDYKW